MRNVFSGNCDFKTAARAGKANVLLAGDVEMLRLHETCRRRNPQSESEGVKCSSMRNTTSRKRSRSSSSR